MAISKFQRGASTFICRVCTRRTRDVGDNGSTRTCQDCFDLSGLSNEISDGFYTDGERAGRVAENVTKRLVALLEKGGKLDPWVEDFPDEVRRAENIRDERMSPREK